MTRIATPATIADAPLAAQPLLEAVKKQLGTVPNLFRIVANSPAALGRLSWPVGRFGQGHAACRDPRTHRACRGRDQRLQLLPVGAQLSWPRTLPSWTTAEILANRRGHSNDPKADAAVQFAARVTKARGHVSDDDLRAVKLAGYDDAQVVEIVLHVALNTWTNYINEVAQTVIDFPVAKALAA